MHNVNIAKTQAIAKNQFAVAQGCAQATAAQTAALAAKQQLRTLRIAKQQALLLSKHVANKQARYVLAVQKSNNSAYQLAVAQLQQQYGVAPTVQLARTNGTPLYAPSTPQANGVCKQVHALCVMHKGVRANVLAACKQAGINPATAATQFAVYKKQHG